MLNDNVYYCIIDHTIGALDQSVALVENKKEENLLEQVSAMSVQVLEEENEEHKDIIKGTQSHVIVIYNISISELKKQINETPSSQPVTVAKQDTLSDSEISSSDSEISSSDPEISSSDPEISSSDPESETNLESGIMTIIIFNLHKN